MRGNAASKRVSREMTGKSIGWFGGLANLQFGLELCADIPTSKFAVMTLTVSCED